MNPKDLKKYRDWLRNRWPVAGGLFQRKAVKRLAEDLSPEGIPLLVEALSAPDGRARKWGEKALRSLQPGKDREMVDALCRLAMSDPCGPAAKLCIAADKQPSDPREACLFLFVTGQLEAYFQTDDSFRGLHTAYEAADETMKDRVLEILRSGDQRLEGFFSDFWKLPQCSEKEIRTFTEFTLRQGNSPQLFSAFLELPLKYGIPLLEPLRASGWEPEDGELNCCYGDFLKEISERGLEETLTGKELFHRFKNQKRQAFERLVEHLRPEGIPLLVEALSSPDRYISGLADKTLRSLQERQDRDCIDALCRLVMEDPSGAAAEICMETGKRPSDPEESCLFLVVTGQLDAYFREDDRFQGLSLAYEAADEKIKARVMDILRSGDRRFDGFFSGPRELRRCTGKEISIFVEYALRHGNWPRLFRAFLELPLKFGYPLLEHFRTSSWEPEDPELNSLYRQALAWSSGAALPDQAPAAMGSVLDRWLKEGEGGSWDRASSKELLTRLQEATPPEGVAIVTALAKKGGITEETAAAVQSNPHWLVRLAGYLTGIIRDLNGPAEGDGIYWVRELGGIEGVLDFRPVRATPAEAEKLAAAPPEVFLGKPGAVRRVLSLLVNNHAEVGVHEALEIEADETAAVLERAD